MSLLQNLLIHDHHIEASILLKYFIKEKKITEDTKLSRSNQSFLLEIIKKRSLGFPLQYITQEVNFYKSKFYVNSSGLPQHNMMKGITNWQQQIPINQEYNADNNWAIPIFPSFSKEPLSTKSNLMKGALAIAVNGVPIFNPLNNRGEDANLIGELDEWGGHCGKADDYHFIFLQPT